MRVGMTPGKIPAVQFPPSKLEMIFLRKIIDSHAHVFPDKIAEKATESIGEFYSLPMGLDGSVRTLLELSEKHGISAFLIQSVATAPQQVQSINDFIAGVVKQFPDKFIGFGALHPGMDEPEQEIERILALGLKGVKLHPDFQKFEADSEAAMRLYALMEGRLPLLIHAGDKRYGYSRPQRIAHILDAFPKLDVIAAHFGGWSQWEESQRCLAGRRVWIDTSSSLYDLAPERARELIGSFGEDYVLFGTDYPMWRVDEELERLSALGLSELVMEKILHENLERLLDL